MVLRGDAEGELVGYINVCAIMSEVAAFCFAIAT